jgi:GNAT superfamily N-acetyltransferase
MGVHYPVQRGLAASSDRYIGLTRALGEHELSLYGKHLQRLHRHSRRSRFGNEVSDRFLQDYVGRVDLTNTAILGYFDGDEMRGAAEIRSMRNIWCDAAEAAFSVEAQWRSQGIGSRLMMDALAMSRELGVEQIHLICDRHNRPMQRIAEKVCADIRFEGDDYLAQISVPTGRSQGDVALCFAAGPFTTGFIRWGHRGS